MSEAKAEPASENVPEVEAAVRAAIRAEGGRINFARFLQICLYHPSAGYYASFGLPGEAGARAPAADYFTSVDLHPAFGRLLAREAAVHLERARKSGATRLWVVEQGAGRGLLARDVLQALAAEAPALFDAVRYLIVEPNRGWVDIQRRNLHPEFEGKVEWVRAAGAGLPLRGVAGVFLSNELFDALPFHIVVGGRPPREVFVAERTPGGELAEEEGELSDPRLDLAVRTEGAVALPPGARAEVALGVDMLGEAAARALRVGAIVAVDYGDEAQALFDARKRPEGTMRCFYRHRLNDEPLKRLGRQDITAHVDFSALGRAFERGGAKVQRVERQRDFLAARGLGGLLEGLEADRGRLEREVYLRHRRAMEALADERGLGNNLVILAWK